jgi:hypothetical protein
MRIEIDYPGMTKEMWPNLVRFTRPAPGTNFITYSSVSLEGADQLIREQIEFFGRNDQPFHWKIYVHDYPEGFGDSLLGNGFREVDQDAVMILDQNRAPKSLLKPIDRDVRSI